MGRLLADDFATEVIKPRQARQRGRRGNDEQCQSYKPTILVIHFCAVRAAPDPHAFVFYCTLYCGNYIFTKSALERGDEKGEKMREPM